VRSACELLNATQRSKSERADGHQGQTLLWPQEPVERRLGRLLFVSALPVLLRAVLVIRLGQDRCVGRVIGGRRGRHGRLEGLVRQFGGTTALYGSRARGAWAAAAAARPARPRRRRSRLSCPASPHLPSLSQSGRLAGSASQCEPWRLRTSLIGSSRRPPTTSTRTRRSRPSRRPSTATPRSRSRPTSTARPLPVAHQLTRSAGLADVCACFSLR
jgi:hypothetical protein